MLGRQPLVCITDERSLRPSPLISGFLKIQVDAFTNSRFGGNPAAVCLIPKESTLDDSTMQKIAAENNLAETAYVELVRRTCDKLTDCLHAREHARLSHHC